MKKSAKMFVALIATVFSFLSFACGEGYGIENDNNNNNENQNNENSNQNNNNNSATGGVILYSEIYPDTTEVMVFEDSWIASVELENTAEEAAVIEQLMFYVSEPLAPEIRNARLYLGETVIATLDNNQTAGFRFRPDGGSVLSPGAKAVYQFRAQFESGLCRDTNTPFMPTVSENRARGQVTDGWFTFSPSGNPVQGNATRRIVGNAISVGLGPDNPPAGDVAQFTDNAKFLQVAFFAGEDMMITKWRYHVYTGMSQYLGFFRLWRKDSQDQWVMFAGPEDSDWWSCSGADCYVSLDDTIDLGKCEELRVTATLEIDNPPVGSTISVNIDPTGLEAVSYGSGEDLPQDHIILMGDPSIWGNTMTIISGD